MDTFLLLFSLKDWGYCSTPSLAATLCKFLSSQQTIAPLNYVKMNNRVTILQDYIIEDARKFGFKRLAFKAGSTISIPTSLANYLVKQKVAKRIYIK